MRMGRIDRGLCAVVAKVCSECEYAARQFQNDARLKYRGVSERIDPVLHILRHGFRRLLFQSGHAIEMNGHAMYKDVLVRVLTGHDLLSSPMCAFGVANVNRTVAAMVAVKTISSNFSKKS